MIQNNDKIQAMTQGGERLGKILDALLKYADVGITLLSIDKLAEQLINEYGGSASFKSVEDYKYSTCLSVNDVVVHGLPTSYKLKDGDILGIDVGLYYQGYHTDTAWTKPVGRIDKSTSKFLEIGQKALSKAISSCVEGNRIWDISKAIEDTVRSGGYSPVRQLVGHGVGEKLHEAPQVPCFKKGERTHSPVLKIGQTLAIEIIYNQGNFPVVYKNDDGWSIKTEDNSLSGLYEHTVLITQNKPVVLTKNREFDKIRS